MIKPMTNYNERLDELLQQNIQFEYIGRFPEAAHHRENIVHINGNVYKFDFTEAKQALTSLIKELVAEAKPDRQPPMKMGNPTKESSDLDKMIFAKKRGHNEAIDQFEQNLLKALEEKK